jgi:hypothetical protein
VTGARIAPLTVLRAIVGSTHNLHPGKPLSRAPSMNARKVIVSAHCTPPRQPPGTGNSLNDLADPEGLPTDARTARG